MKNLASDTVCIRTTNINSSKPSHHLQASDLFVIPYLLPKVLCTIKIISFKVIEYSLHRL